MDLSDSFCGDSSGGDDAVDTTVRTAVTTAVVTAVTTAVEMVVQTGVETAAVTTAVRTAVVAAVTTRSCSDVGVTCRRLDAAHKPNLFRGSRSISSNLLQSHNLPQILRDLHNSPISPCPLEAKRRILARKSPHCCLCVSACD